MDSFIEFNNPDIQLVCFLFLIALTAGCLDTLAGGGGLLTLPALLITGMPPVFALGTNKFQATLGTATATFMMLKHRRIKLHQIWPSMVLAFSGSLIGALLVQWFLLPETLSFLIPAVLILIAGYFLFSGSLLNKIHPVKLLPDTYKLTVVPAIGFYDGMFGPGTGSFFSLAGVSLQGKTLLEATAIAKSLNFATNIAALFAFLSMGNIVWVIGLIMMTGQGFGAWFGSHLLFRANPQYLRILIVAMSILMLLSYIANNY